MSTWQRTARTHGLAIVAWLWAAAFLFGTRTQPLRMNWGDTMSDSNVQTSGRYFARYGFVNLRFTPVIDVGPLRPDSLRYTHYPPLPDLVNGVQQALFGEADISTFRIFADLLTLASLVFLYRWVRSLWGDITANVTLVLLTTNMLWLQYADTIHHVPLYWFCGFATLDLVARWLDDGKGRRLLLAVATTFLCMMASYDYFFFLPLAVAATIWMKGRRLRDRAVRPLLAAIVGGVTLAVLTKFSLVAWTTGFGNLVDDFVFQLHERATSKHSMSYRAGIAPTFFYRTIRFFTPVFFIVLGLQVVAIVHRLRRRGEETGMPSLSPLLLLACGVPFVALFSQLFVEQYHPMLQFMPYYAVSTAAFVAWLWEQRGRAGRALAVVAVLVAVAWEGREIAIFDKTFLARDDAAKVHDYLAKNDKRNVIFTNSWADAPTRFYFERHVLGIPVSTKADMDYFMTHFFFEDGDEPVHYIDFNDVDQSAIDKHLYGIFAAEKKWTWIADPIPHKAEISEYLRRRSEKPDRVFREFGRLVADAGRMRVYVLDRQAFDRAQIASLGDEETTLIDFNDDSSTKYKVMGIRYNEKTESGPGFSWTISRPLKHYRFTMQGLMHEPDGRPVSTAVLRLRSTPAHRRLRIMALRGAPAQQIEVRWNGTSLGRAESPADWGELSFDIPKQAFDPSGLQRLEIHTDQVNEYSLAVALRWIRIEPIEEAR
ncbi:MAG: hypothetical protein JWP87_5004 [Labilithrix sp.]|nr:hypothetical protein [Labilithrix sp.]